MRGHYSAISDISWSDDGQYLVSVSDGEVYTWHMETYSRRVGRRRAWVGEIPFRTADAGW